MGDDRKDLVLQKRIQQTKEEMAEWSKAPHPQDSAWFLLDSKLRSAHRAVVGSNFSLIPLPFVFSCGCLVLEPLRRMHAWMFQVKNILGRCKAISWLFDFDFLIYFFEFQPPRHQLYLFFFRPTCTQLQSTLLLCSYLPFNNVSFLQAPCLAWKEDA